MLAVAEHASHVGLSSALSRSGRSMGRGSVFLKTRSRSPCNLWSARSQIAAVLRS